MTSPLNQSVGVSPEFLVLDIHFINCHQQLQTLPLLHFTNGSGSIIDYNR